MPRAGPPPERPDRCVWCGNLIGIWKGEDAYETKGAGRVWRIKGLTRTNEVEVEIGCSHCKRARIIRAKDTR
jgi:hypothetical protein